MENTNKVRVENITFLIFFLSFNDIKLHFLTDFAQLDHKYDKIKNHKTNRE